MAAGGALTAQAAYRRRRQRRHASSRREAAPLGRPLSAPPQGCIIAATDWGKRGMSGSGTGDTGRPAGWGAAGAAETPAGQLRRKFPTFNDLQRRARRRVARFAYDFVAGGV